MNTRLLAESEYQATFSERMVAQNPDSPAPFDFWPYVERIPVDHFQGFDCSESSVSHVYRESGGRFEHVLIDTDNPNVFMAVVLDLEANGVFGHHLLNLVEKYGLEEVEDPN